MGVAFALEGGATGVLTSVWHDVPGRLSSRHLEIFCERGRFWADGNAAEVVGWELEAGAARSAAVTGLIDELTRRGAQCPTNADAAFVEAVGSGRPASPTSPPRCGPTCWSTRCTARRRPVAYAVAPGWNTRLRPIARAPVQRLAGHTSRGAGWLPHAHPAPQWLRRGSAASTPGR